MLLRRRAILTNGKKDIYLWRKSPSVTTVTFNATLLGNSGLPTNNQWASMTGTSTTFGQFRYDAGYTESYWKPGSSINATSLTCSLNKTTISGYGGGMLPYFYSTSKIDLKGYKYLSLIYDLVSTQVSWSGSLAMGVGLYVNNNYTTSTVRSSGLYTYSSNFAYPGLNTPNATNQTLTLNVSSYSSGYILFDVIQGEMTHIENFTAYTLLLHDKEYTSAQLLQLK